MRIVVLVKQVPDTYGDRHLVLETGLVDRNTADQVADEVGERAVEAALAVKAVLPDTTITAVTMGPVSAAETLRKALAMGADAAVHVVDDGLVGADLTLTAEVLATALRRQEADLVIAGNLSTDGASGVLPAMLAELLGMAQLTYLTSLDVDATTARGTRGGEVGATTAEAALPAVVSITEALPDPKLPSFRGIMAAKKKTIETLSATDLGADVLGERAPRAIVLSAAERPPRTAGTKITDDGEGGKRLAEYLVAQKLV